MTRYLDREAVTGDSVHIEYDAVFSHRGQDSGIVIAGMGALSCVAPANASVRVIAPEPKVGDVVTADMDLPEGSIIEFNSGHERQWTYNLAYRKAGRWCTAHGDDSAAFSTVPPHWRIVRIGGAS